MDELINHELWWSGPAWLRQSDEYWPEQSTAFNTHEEERSRVDIQVMTISKLEAGTIEEILNRYSGYFKMRKIMAIVINFKQISRKQRDRGHNINNNDLMEAARYLFRTTQQQYFDQELQCLMNGDEIPNKSKLLALNPFIDKDGLMRVGGRIDKANLSYAAKHPIILPNNSPLTKAIVLDHLEL